MTEWLTDWLTDWLTNWVTDWLTDWMNDWLNCWIAELLNCWIAEYMLRTEENVSYRNILSAKANRSEIFLFSDTSPRQANIVQVFNRSRDWPCIKWCSANGRGTPLVLRIDCLLTYNRDSNDFALVFDWLASSYGNLVFVFSWTILRLYVLC